MGSGAAAAIDHHLIDGFGGTEEGWQCRRSGVLRYRRFQEGAVKRALRDSLTTDRLSRRTLSAISDGGGP